MQLFACHACKQVLFFESVSCTRCSCALAYLPDRGLVSDIVPAQDSAGTWIAAGAGGGRYRLCKNYRELAVCNWAIPAGEDGEYCRACRLNVVIPNLGDPAAQAAWHKLEIAKRRLIYSLLALGLPLETKSEHARGLSFSFLKQAGEAPVYTGHADGAITLNVAEADDPFREKMRVQLGETYRTLLGHFRHEIGHYYWYRLIEDQPARLEAFRATFGDDRADYATAQQRHYNQGPPPDWQGRFVSAYASMHPWEDWAETWAHYLHMVDTLDTARAYGLSLRAAAAAGAIAPLAVKARRIDLASFDDLVEAWVPLTLALNSLNRSMGTPDSYPFVLSQAALAKLRFVHDVIDAAGSCP